MTGPAMPNRVSDRHRELAGELVAAFDSPRHQGRVDWIRNAHAWMGAGWRGCPVDLEAAVESARAILRVPKRDRQNANGQGSAMTKRAFDCPDPLWHAGVATAQENGRTIAGVLRDALEEYIAEESQPAAS